MTRLLIRFTESANAFTTKMNAFTAALTQQNDTFAAQVRKIQEEDELRPIEDMPFAERHNRIVKHRKEYVFIATVQVILRAFQFVKFTALCAVAIGIGVAIAHVVGVVTP